MLKFRKKPIVIEAVQLTVLNIKECYELVNGHNVAPIGSWSDFEKEVIKKGLDVPTLEDGIDKRVKHVANIGDYIIKGVQGELYPCKPDIFKQTYEQVV